MAFNGDSYDMEKY